MCVCCFFDTLLKAFKLLKLSVKHRAEHCTDPHSDRSKRKGTEPFVAIRNPRAWACTQTHRELWEALQEERLHDGLMQADFFCKHTMPFLQLWFHSLSLLILVNDQKNTIQQPVFLRREYLDFYAYITRN